MLWCSNVCADVSIKDGEPLSLPTKDLGSCEIYPQSLTHSPNGRFVSVCGDGEYIIYTALAWRNKAFGPALDFVWAGKDNSNDYAIRESSTSVRLYRNFKEKSGGLDVGFAAEGLMGGVLLGVRGQGGVGLFDWETGGLVRRIDVVPNEVGVDRLRVLRKVLTESTRSTGLRAVNSSPWRVMIPSTCCASHGRRTLRPSRTVPLRMTVSSLRLRSLSTLTRRGFAVHA